MIGLSLFGSAAQATPIDLTPSQVSQIGWINVFQNHRLPHHLTRTHGNCQAVAFQKLIALNLAGFPYSAMRSVVYFPRGGSEAHEVLIFDARIRGRRTDLILDMNSDALIWE